MINLTDSKLHFDDENPVKLFNQRLSFLFNIHLFTFQDKQNLFSIVTKDRLFLIQPIIEKDFFDWLYAFDPLFGGQIQ